MKISIIIPCYNVEEYIEEALASCFEQTYANIEVIAVDNNSKDNTWQKLQSLQAIYPRLIIVQEDRAGAPYARNKGLALSTGDWCQFLDADDLLLPNKIKHQVALIDKTKDISFIAGACIKRRVSGEENRVSVKDGNPFISLFTTSLGITSANLWNKKWLTEIGGWDVNRKSSQEADLMFRLLQQNEEVIIDNEPLTIVRERDSGQISQGNQADNWHRYFTLRMDMAEWLAENRPELYALHEDKFKDTLFGILKIISLDGKRGFSIASQLHKKYFSNYKPSKNQKHSTKPYLLLYNLFGFTVAEFVGSVGATLRGRPS